MAEKWKAITGFEGHYEVSNKGRIKSLKRKHRPKESIMKPRSDKDGYQEFCARKDGVKKYIKVHRAVYEAFVGPIPEGHVINHRNNVKTNNHPTNLETMTVGENNRHAKEWRDKHNLKKRKPLTKDEVLTIRWELETGACRREIAKRWGLVPARIYDIEYGKVYGNIK